MTIISIIYLISELMDLKYPRGVKDLMPNEAISKEELVEKVKAVFTLFGFYPIDTPVFESLDVLFAKNAIGEEDKLIYKIQDSNLGLRYDHTVSLARFFAMHNDVQLPFKRYIIDKIWRREEPQKMRYREVIQADIDILGGNQFHANAEVIAATAAALSALGIKYEIHINDRRILDKFIKSIGIDTDADDSMPMKIMHIIDKNDKLDGDKISDLLNNLGLGDEKVNQIMEFIGLQSGNNEKLNYLRGILKQEDQQVIKEIEDLLNELEYYGFSSEPIIDFSIVRGLDYYTSLIFEFKLSDKSSKSSIAAGGRYDNLISVYSSKSMPAVGASIGISRVMDYLKCHESKKLTNSVIYIAYINEGNYAYAVKAAGMLREAGIATDLNISDKNLSNQMRHASMLNFRLAAIIGDNEQAAGEVTLRDFASGDEKKVKLEYLVSEVKNRLTA